MLECGLPSMYYLKNHHEEPTILEMFGKYIETPPSITDLLKIDGARFNKDNEKTTMVLDELSSTISAYMLGWYNSYQDINIGDLNHNGKIDLKDIILLIKIYLDIE